MGTSGRSAQGPALVLPVSLLCGGKENCRDDRKCLTHDLWASLNERIFDYLNGVSLAQLVTKAQADEAKVIELKDQRAGRGQTEPAVPA